VNETNNDFPMPLKAEGMPAHPDAVGFAGSDDEYLTMLRAYADWRGREETMREICVRPHLLKML